MSVARILTRKYETLEDLDFQEGTILIHGASLDERGSNALSISNPMLANRIMVSYSHEAMTLSVGGEEKSADLCVELFQNPASSGPVVLEGTTLGFAELFCAIRSLVELRVNNFQVIYAEPGNYAQQNPGSDSFELSDLLVGYKPIPNAVVDLSSEAVEAGVFFLGFEPERLERALEEYQMISSKEIKVIFGVPAFKPGWELNSLIPHLQTLSDKQGFDIAYCAANDPSAAYECLEKTRKSLSDGNRMFVAPIGTKPCGIAAALFASMHPEQVGLLYDHPQRRKNRSKGIGVWHKFDISIN